MSPKTEVILAHAELAATYFRALVDKGVPVDSAVSMTSSYVSSTILSERYGKPPQEPWEDRT